MTLPAQTFELQVAQGVTVFKTALAMVFLRVTGSVPELSLCVPLASTSSKMDDCKQIAELKRVEPHSQLRTALDATVGPDSHAANDTWLDIARREALLLKEGGIGFKQAAQDTLKNHKLETVGKAALSFGLGVGIAYLSRGRGLGAVAARAVTSGAALSFAADLGTNGMEIAGAVVDTARSPDRFVHNAEVMRANLGKFAFDTTLNSLSGLGGGLVGHSAFNVRLANLPPELVPQMNGRGISQDYYNKLFMVERDIHVIRNSEGQFSHEKVVRSLQGLPGHLQKVITYKQYWNTEFANYKGLQPLDRTAAMNVLLHGNTQARKLDRVSQTLLSMKDSDLTSLKVQNKLYANMQTARSIIYDK